MSFWSELRVAALDILACCRDHLSTVASVFGMLVDYEAIAKIAQDGKFNAK